MKQIIKQGTTSKRLVVFIQDASKTTGVGLTGLTNASSGLIWYYYREDSTAAAAISVVAETLGTWTSGGFKEISSSNLPGLYELGVPDAVLAATNSPTWAIMQLSGVTNMVPVNVEVELSAFDLTTNTHPVNVAQWLGTAVTAATAGVPDVNVKNYNNVVAQTDAGSLPKVDVERWKANAVVTPNTPGVPQADVTLWNGNAVSLTVTGTSTNPTVFAFGVGDKTGYALSATQAFSNTGTWTGPVGSVTAGVTVATNSDKTGYSLTQTFPSNFASLLISAGGTVTANVGATFPTNFSSLSIDSSGRVTVAPGQFTVKKNTGLSGFTFPMYSSSAPNDLQSGLTVIATVSIDGGALQSTVNSVTAVGSGLYKINLAAADLNGTTITLVFTATGALDSTVTLVTQA